MIYDGSNALSLIFQPEGSITKSSGAYTYNYFKTDHVGSTRVMMSAISNGSTIDWHQAQANDFYPFGVVHDDIFNNLSANKYLFNGKEIQDASIYGNMLGIYDYGARYYDPVLGRWFTHDPKLQVPNPYLFCGNSPGMYIDPDGQFFFLAGLIPALLSTASLIHKLTSGQIKNFWDFAKFWAVNAITSLAGAGIGNVIGEGLKASLSLGGGFINGALVAGGSGAASGFAGGAANTWLSGGSLGQGLRAGFKGAVIGGGVGALTGGLIKGIQDAKNGYSFLNGTKTVDFEWDASGSAADYSHDELTGQLKSLTKERFRAEEGDFGMQEITTQSDNGYSMLENGKYWNIEKETGALGFARLSSGGASSVHISPYVVKSGDMVLFDAVVGHELTHVRHNLDAVYANIRTHFGKDAYDNQSEAGAWTYSYRVFYGNGHLKRAEEAADMIKKFANPLLPSFKSTYY